MRIRRPSPAMVVALAALVLGAGGTATAGALITSRAIEDNTIRSADIRDETIGSRDIRNGALSGVIYKGHLYLTVPTGEGDARRLVVADLKASLNLDRSLAVVDLIR